MSLCSFVFVQFCSFFAAVTFFFLLHSSSLKIFLESISQSVVSLVCFSGNMYACVCVCACESMQSIVATDNCWQWSCNYADSQKDNSFIHITYICKYSEWRHRFTFPRRKFTRAHTNASTNKQTTSSKYKQTTTNNFAVEVLSYFDVDGILSLLLLLLIRTFLEDCFFRLLSRLFPALTHVLKHSPLLAVVPDTLSTFMMMVFMCRNEN